MNLTSVTRVLSGAAAVALLSGSLASAATVRMPGAMSHARYAPAHIGTVQHDTTCPPSYFACGVPPYSAGWCVSTTGNCSSGLVGDWDWTAVVTTIKKGKPTNKATATWSPDPGNPSTVTFALKSGKTGKGKKLKFAAALSTCEVTSGTCFSDFETYGITN